MEITEDAHQILRFKFVDFFITHAVTNVNPFIRSIWETTPFDQIFDLKLKFINFTTTIYIIYTTIFIKLILTFPFWIFYQELFQHHKWY